jgi:MFS family permease
MNSEVFRSLRHKNYRLFFAGQFISVMGTWLQLTAMPWLVFRTTNSPFLLGAIGFVSQIFILLLSPFAGAVADHYDKKKILIFTQTLAMFQAFAFAALMLSGRIQLWHIFALATFIGIVNAFDMPTRQSFVVRMVGKDDLVNAIGLNSFIFNSGRMIGPAIAGFVIAWAGEGVCFLLNGVSFLAVIVALFFIKTKPLAPQEGDSQGIMEKFVSGYKYVRRHRGISSMLLLLSVTGLTSVFPMTLMPMIVKNIYNMGASGLGLFMGAAGAGALLGTYKVTSIKSAENMEMTIFSSSIIFALLISVFSFVKFVPAALLLLVGLGYFLVLQMAMTNTYVQLAVSDEMRGRVMGFFTTAFMGFAPLGSFMAGSLAHRLGAQATMAIGGAISIIAAFSLKNRIFYHEQA